MWTSVCLNKTVYSFYGILQYFQSVVCYKIESVNKYFSIVSVVDKSILKKIKHKIFHSQNVI